MPLSDKTYQVFVSSTFTDMKDERQAAVEAILETHNIPAGMELFAANNQSQMEVIRRWIKASDIFLLILGGRYGSIESSTQLSYIELEYKCAAELQKPLFAIVLSDDWITKKAIPPTQQERESGPKYNLFRAQVLLATSSIVSDTKDIKLAIHKSIKQITSDNNLAGWIRGDTVTADPEVANQLAKLMKENEELKSQLGNDNDPKAERCIARLKSIPFLQSSIMSPISLFDVFRDMSEKLKSGYHWYTLRSEFVTNYRANLDYNTAVSEYTRACSMMEGLGLAETYKNQNQDCIRLSELGMQVRTRMLYNEHVKPTLPE